MDRNPSSLMVDQRHNRRDTIQFVVDTLYTIKEHILHSTSNNTNVNSLQELGGSEPDTFEILRHITRIGERYLRPLQVRKLAIHDRLSQNDRRFSVPSEIHQFVNQISLFDSNNTSINSLHTHRRSKTSLSSERLSHVQTPNISRRRALQFAGYTAATGTFGAAVQAAQTLEAHANENSSNTPSQTTSTSTTTEANHEAANSIEVDREQHTILDGTQYETTLHTITGPDDGPTVMIFGGVHGNERGGIEAAQLATDYTIDGGTLVVSPKTNKAAVDMEGNHGPEGDLNRQFPVGATPTTDVARGIWDEILRVEPDFIIDLHTATTLISRGSVGQGIFPTRGVVDNAEQAATAVNAQYGGDLIMGDRAEHDFQVGTVISEEKPRLLEKAKADQGIEGWVTEVTRIDLTMDERTFLHDMLTRELLHQVGITVTSDPEISNPL